MLQSLGAGGLDKHQSKQPLTEGTKQDDEQRDFQVTNEYRSLSITSSIAQISFTDARGGSRERLQILKRRSEVRCWVSDNLTTLII